MDQFAQRVARFREAIAIDRSFDVIERKIEFAGRRALLVMVDAFVKDDILEKLMEFFYALKPDDPCFSSTEKFLARAVPYCECDAEPAQDKAITAVLSGQTVLLLEGIEPYLLLDMRTYPQRDTAEPEKDKVFRGSHDGFVETIVFNCALIRRRIRSPALHMEPYQIGASSHTDVVLCYMDDRVDRDMLDAIRDRLSSLHTDALTMNQQSLTELLLPYRWYDPLPRFKLSERPDTTAAQVLEGDVAILVDNSPSVITLPTTLFDVMEQANDFYFPPVTGSYLRLVRYFVLLLMLVLTPLWLFFCRSPWHLAPQFTFILPDEMPVVPLFWQLLLLELGIDALKLATLNIPSMLTTSLSVIAGIVVGDFAVQSGWFCAESMLYMAFVALATFNQPSVELGYAIKFARVVLLVLTQLFGGWGLLAGLVLVFVQLVRSRTFGGKHYLYPLLPFDGKVLRRKLFRASVQNTPPSYK